MSRQQLTKVKENGMLIGLVGFAGSGKGTVAQSLHRDLDYTIDSFAKPIKDASALIFGWDRKLLEGDTRVSRRWREQPDKFWSKEFDDPKFTPRKAMQRLGTEACRNNIGNSIWVASLVKRWQDAGQPNTVVADCRFPNEIEAIRDLGGKILRIKRGPEPTWYQTILFSNKGFSDEEELDQINQLRAIRSIPHESETAWIGCEMDEVFSNEGEIIELETAISEYVGGLSQLTLDI